MNYQFFEALRNARLKGGVVPDAYYAYERAKDAHFENYRPMWTAQGLVLGAGPDGTFHQFDLPHDAENPEALEAFAKVLATNGWTGVGAWAGDFNDGDKTFYRTGPDGKRRAVRPQGTFVRLYWSQSDVDKEVQNENPQRS